jgi:hypothetical protein
MLAGRSAPLCVILILIPCMTIAWPAQLCVFIDNPLVITTWPDAATTIPLIPLIITRWTPLTFNPLDILACIPVAILARTPLTSLPFSLTRACSLSMMCFIDHGHHGHCYLILLAHQIHDLPSKTSARIQWRRRRTVATKVLERVTHLSSFRKLILGHHCKGSVSSQARVGWREFLQRPGLSRFRACAKDQVIPV